MLRKLVLPAACAALSLAACRVRSSTPDAARPVEDRIDASASSDARAFVDGANADGLASTEARGAIRCEFEGSDRLLAPMPITRLRIAAHGDEAMLVTEYTSSFAPDPAGDAVDTHASRWWLFDLARPERDSAARGGADPLGAAQPQRDEDNPSVCDDRQWGEDAERPVWQSDRWTRWRHASAWGGPACSPCGTLRARVGALGVRAQQQDTTDVMSELEVSTVGAFTFGAALLKRYDYRGPSDGERNVCSEVGVVIESLIPNGSGFERRELRRTRMDDSDDEPMRVATAATDVGGIEGAVVTVHGVRRQRIELRRVDERGRSIAAARVLHTASNVGFVGAGYLGSQLVVLWNEGTEQSPTERPNLRWVTLDPRSVDATPSVQTLHAPQGRSIAELSLASDGQRLALFWVERPARGPSIGRVAVASTRSAFAADVARGGTIVAQPTLPGAIYASSVAIAGERVWVAFSDPVRRGAVRPRVRSLRCTSEPAESRAP